MATEKPPTQQELVLAMLRRAGPRGITPLQALEQARCMRLAAVVHRLKADGHDISNEGATVGPEAKHVARYVLHEQPVQLDMGYPSAYPPDLEPRNVRPFLQPVRR